MCDTQVYVRRRLRFTSADNCWKANGTEENEFQRHSVLVVSVALERFCGTTWRRGMPLCGKLLPQGEATVSDDPVIG